MRVSKTFLDTSMTIAAGGADKDNPRCQKMEVFVQVCCCFFLFAMNFFHCAKKEKSTKVKVFIRMECMVGLCTLESRQHFFTSSFANGCQVSLS